ncbi:MAG: cytochrome C biogenesis protein, partial [Bacteroidota bacterium]
MGIEYTGEHTLFQGIGIFFVYLSFCAAIASSLSYLLSIKDSSWKNLGRIFFKIHTLAVVGIVSMMFIMLFNAWYEFSYVWEHRNNAMPLKYILSCFWEGQEGSFLLWTFWNIILGNILIRTAKNWEPEVMANFSLVQVFLSSMLLGVYILDYKMGSNPFIL